MSLFVRHALVLDLVVDVEQGECGERGCAENRRPVTFDAQLEVDEASATSLGLEPEDIDAVNEALAEVELTEDLIKITVTDDEGRTREVEDEETVCLEPGEYEVEATLANEATLERAVVAELVGLDPDLTADNITIEKFEDSFVVEECPDDNGDTIDIDDRDQTNVCNNVANIITRDVQNPDVEVNNEQAVSGTVSGDVSNEQVVDIAQELNVSPVIVQQCIQQNAGRDTIIGDEDSNSGSDNDDDDDATGVKDSRTNTTEDCIIVEEETITPTNSASATTSATESVTQECIIVDTAPNKKLPFTGGWPVMYYRIVAGFVLVGASLLGTGLGVWRARQR